MRGLFIHTGEENQFFRQGGQAGNLFACAFRPLVFSAGHLQHFGVCINDCQWSFDFVAGIRNKTLLFFVAFCNRLYQHAGKKNHQKKYQ